MQTLLSKILEKVKKADTIAPYTDLYRVCLAVLNTDIPLAVSYLTALSDQIGQAIGASPDEAFVRALFSLHRQVLLAAAPYHFESYLLFTEWNRAPKRKFYPPRRAALKLIVDALQDLEDGKLQLLGVSLPPGTGKTTLALFYLSWIAGRHPGEPSLTGSHSNAFVRGAYDECLRLMDPKGEYLWQEVFPDVRISSTNAKDCRIDIGQRKRFETLEFTSIGTGNAGLYRASRLLYCDDLVSGIEVALSKERLDKLWEIYTTDLRQRKIGDHCKELHIATRWSVHDILGRLQAQYGESEKARFITVPALDENDESHFDYAYGVGFSSEALKAQREIMEDASWRALYMNQPIEREGLLYHEEELRRYFALPQGEPDGIYAVCDTKDRGSDYCCMPIAYQYGRDFYIEEILCDNANPEVVEARLDMALRKHKVQLARFESNAAGGRVAQKVQEAVKQKGGSTRITTKYTTANKETRIIVASGFVKDRFLFKDGSVQGKEYRRAMGFLCGYTMTGKNKNDDVPDAMSMLADFVESFAQSKVEVFARPF